jgi:hypothetical protein
MRRRRIEVSSTGSEKTEAATGDRAFASIEVHRAGVCMYEVVKQAAG